MKRIGIGVFLSLILVTAIGCGAQNIEKSDSSNDSTTEIAMIENPVVLKFQEKIKNRANEEKQKIEEQERIVKEEQAAKEEPVPMVEENIEPVQQLKLEILKH